MAPFVLQRDTKTEIETDKKYGKKRTNLDGLEGVNHVLRTSKKRQRRGPWGLDLVKNLTRKSNTPVPPSGGGGS